MTKIQALRMMLDIVEECNKNSERGDGCRECAFGCGTHCLVANGNDIPSDWLITKKVYEWMKGDEK